MRTIQLKTLARLINEQWGPAYYATCEPWITSTDRKPEGCRYITHTGKGRKGYRLRVYGPALPGALMRPVVIDHNSSEPYRTNEEAMRKVAAIFGMIWDPKHEGPKGTMAWRYVCDGHGAPKWSRKYKTKAACEAVSYCHEQKCGGKTRVVGEFTPDPEE